ncbi:IclR family transcriptional regulator [Nesterenkonia sp. AN1]|uniref:IclR family transcriptional regulator n=1 Tax=Nesterenkonia aurantiaca TaxID=1436010 RepID=A0A4R7G244_9MICC|nr:MULTISPECIES: IclR family transcriptional regulator [Nesterenkonia]EXF26050.1 IclR family transcriptional regulator [Nesterenkonia sp. AN1]TDS85384.1 IclR family transcriptional regulator [Nesterenkonia aurantiaca]
MANSPSGDAVLDRAMRILAALETRPSLPAGELIDAAGLPRTTGYRLLRTMRAHGLLATAASGELVLGQRLWEIAQRAPISRTLRTSALPFMHDVNAVVRQTTQLAVLDEHGVLIVERISRHGAVVNPAEVATTMPAHLTSMGHVLLAHSPAHVVDHWWAPRQQLIAESRPQLRRELAEARTRGHAQLSGMINAETTGVSVPVLGADGHAVAALTVVVPRGSREIPQFLMALQTAGRGISRALDGLSH